MLSPTASDLFGPVVSLFPHPVFIFHADFKLSSVASDFFSILIDFVQPVSPSIWNTLLSTVFKRQHLLDGSEGKRSKVAFQKTV